MIARHSHSCALGIVLTLAAAASVGADDARSLFEELEYRSLVRDTKAARVGDVLTVIIQETASASSSADLRSHRSFDVGGRANLSKDRQYGGSRPDLATLGEYSGSIGTDTESDGAGRTQRSGKLLAQISVRVLAVNDNGDFVVAGEQSVRIDNEEQLITLTGLVRPRDVSESNTVLSSRVADARIRFAGEGFVTDQSKPGWLARLFNWIGF